MTFSLLMHAHDTLFQAQEYLEPRNLLLPSRSVLVIKLLFSPLEYTTYAIKPELQETWKNHASPDGKYLSAERLIATFAGLIKHAIDQINRSGECPKYR